MIKHNRKADSIIKKQRRIQVVDDETDIISSLKLGLEDNGFNVEAFTEPLAALSKFKADFYDLVILDIKMPDMNGFELYKEMRKIDPRVRVLFFTASETYYDDLEHLFPTFNKKQFIVKTTQIEELVEKINTELAS
jgi:two-component system catabolic regulation response regulator CreB/two-component system response regulator ChvI